MKKLTIGPGSSISCTASAKHVPDDCPAYADNTKNEEGNSMVRYYCNLNFITASFLLTILATSLLRGKRYYTVWNRPLDTNSINPSSSVVWMPKFFHNWRIIHSFKTNRHFVSILSHAAIQLTIISWNTVGLDCYHGALALLISINWEPNFSQSRLHFWG